MPSLPFERQSSVSHSYRVNQLLSSSNPFLLSADPFSLLQGNGGSWSHQFVCVIRALVHAQELSSQGHEPSFLIYTMKRIN